MVINNSINDRRPYTWMLIVVLNWLHFNTFTYRFSSLTIFNNTRTIFISFLIRLLGILQPVRRRILTLHEIRLWSLSNSTNTLDQSCFWRFDRYSGNNEAYVRDSFILADRKHSQPKSREWNSKIYSLRMLKIVRFESLTCCRGWVACFTQSWPGSVAWPSVFSWHVPC